MDSASEIVTSSDESITREKRFSCTFDGCSKKFTKKRKLINHSRLHSDERPFVCDVPECDKKYTNSSHLRRHKKAKHEQHKTKVICTVTSCGRELSHKSNLKRHMDRWHNSNREFPFNCSECQQGFPRKKQLQQHSYLHTGELPFKCDQCEAKFIRICERNRHKRTHKTYTCECGDVHIKWTSLRAHKKICKLRLFKCPTCDKIFSNGSTLNVHKATKHKEQEDQNIFLCPYEDCSRFYLYKTNLIVHINRFHKKISRPKIPCTYEGCGKLLGKMQNYKIHMKLHKEARKPNNPRNPRKDKGIPKKTARETLFPDIPEPLMTRDIEKTHLSDVPMNLNKSVNTINSYTRQTIDVK